MTLSGFYFKKITGCFRKKNTYILCKNEGKETTLKAGEKLW